MVAAQTMLTRTADRFGLRPGRLVANTGYGSARMLAWLVHEQSLESHIPVFDKSTRKDGTFKRCGFTYDHERDSATESQLSTQNRPFAGRAPAAGVDNPDKG